MTKHSIKEALNDIRAAIAGTDEPTQKSTVKALDAIADAIANGGGGGESGGGAIVIELSGTIQSGQKMQPEMSANIDDWDDLWNNIQSGQPVYAFYKYSSGQVLYYSLVSANVSYGRKTLQLQYIMAHSWRRFEIQGPSYPGGPTDINMYEGTYAAQS